MFRAIEALTGRGERGLIRTPRREVRTLETHFPSRPAELTTKEVLAIFRTHREFNPRAQLEVLKKISGKWVGMPDDAVEGQLTEFVEEIAEVDNPLKAASASAGIDVVVYAPPVSPAASWRMVVSSRVEERFGSGTASYDRDQKKWFTTQDPMRTEYIRSLDIRQMRGA